MKSKFEQWMKDKGYSYNTAYNYATAINRISELYTREVGYPVDIYGITEQQEIKNIAGKISTGGMYSNIGNKGHGTNRAAISRYIEFISNKEGHRDYIKEQPNDFGLKKSLIDNLSGIFPEYIVFEYENATGTVKSDLLLEHKGDRNIIVVDFEPRKANIQIFSQICTYIGLLEKEFPERKITGLIIAEEISEDLKQASSITDKVNLKSYKIKLELIGA